MTILSNDSDELSGTRPHRRITKPKTPVPPKFPTPSPPDEQHWFTSSHHEFQLPTSIYIPKPSHLLVDRASRKSSINTVVSSDETDPIPESSVALVKTINNLGLKILDYGFSLNPHGSIGLCSSNIYHALTIIAAGSANDNAAAFLDVLDFKDFRAMVEGTNSLDQYLQSSPHFSSAAGVFIHLETNARKDWMNLIMKTYRAKLGYLSAPAINRFVGRGTSGMEDNLLEDDELTDSVLALVSTTKFGGRWTIPFNLELTKQNQAFFPFVGKKQICEMMYKAGDMEYVADGILQMVVSPYKALEGDPQFKAAIILPRRQGIQAMGDALSSLQSSSTVLRKFLLGHAKEKASSRISKVELQLPRFILNLNLDIGTSLAEVGLGPLFKYSSGFSGIDEEHQLKLSQAMHALYMEVEEGSEEVGDNRMNAVPRRVHQKYLHQYELMRVNRPFIFLVFDAITGLVVIQTVVSDLDF